MKVPRSPSVTSRPPANLKIVRGNLDVRDLVLQDFTHQASGDFAALGHDGFAGFVIDRVREFQADEVFVDIPLQL